MSFKGSEKIIAIAQTLLDSFGPPPQKNESASEDMRKALLNNRVKIIEAFEEAPAAFLHYLFDCLAQDQSIPQAGKIFTRSMAAECKSIESPCNKVSAMLNMLPKRGNFGLYRAVELWKECVTTYQPEHQPQENPMFRRAREGGCMSFKGSEKIIAIAQTLLDSFGPPPQKNESASEDMREALLNNRVKITKAFEEAPAAFLHYLFDCLAQDQSIPQAGKIFTRSMAEACKSIESPCNKVSAMLNMLPKMGTVRLYRAVELWKECVTTYQPEHQPQENPIFRQASACQERTEQKTEQLEAELCQLKRTLENVRQQQQIAAAPKRTVSPTALFACPVRGKTVESQILQLLNPDVSMQAQQMDKKNQEFYKRLQSCKGYIPTELEEKRTFKCAIGLELMCQPVKVFVTSDNEPSQTYDLKAIITWIRHAWEKSDRCIASDGGIIINSPETNERTSSKNIRYSRSIANEIDEALDRCEKAKAEASGTGSRMVARR